MIKSSDIKIGTKYKTSGKHPKIAQVVDILKTYNNLGELVSTRYVTSHEFLGQEVKEYNVCAVTIQRGHIGE